MRKWFLSFIVACLIMPVGHANAVSKELVGKCGHWLGDALNVGWSRSHISKLDYVMWRESRCLPNAFNSKDPNGGSKGLMQINQFWCLPSRYFPSGWLQSQGVLRSCTSCLILLLICVLLWLFLNTLRNGTIMVGSLGVNSGII
jgi:hypothetical protein